MTIYKLQWFDESEGEYGIFRTQYQSTDIDAFKKGVAEIIEKSKMEGGWMKGTVWQIGEYEEVLTKASDFNPYKDNSQYNGQSEASSVDPMVENKGKDYGES